METVLADVEAHLREQAGDVEAQLLRARMLGELGRHDEALAAFRNASEVAPRHIGARLGIAGELVRRGKLQDASALLTALVAEAPHELEPAVALAGILAVTDAARSRALLENVLMADPGHRAAHEALCAAYAQIGDTKRALLHREAAFTGAATRRQAYRGRAWPRNALALLSTDGGNLEVEPLLPQSQFSVTRLYVEAFDPAIPLPQHEVVVNAIADADIAPERLLKASEILDATSARVVNDPARVLLSSRIRNGQRLNALDGVRAASVVPFDEAEVPQFPFVLRAAGFHMGRYLLRIEDRAQLERALASLPPVPLLAAEWLDTISPDGRYRKYRMMAINGRLFPLHLAIADEWKVHYFSADAFRNANSRDEERRFLEDPRGVLGDRAFAALERVVETVALDYFGIDFALAAGGVTVFEANAAMTVIAPASDDAKFAYRLPSITAILEATRALTAP